MGSHKRHRHSDDSDDSSSSSDASRERHKKQKKEKKDKKKHKKEHKHHRKEEDEMLEKARQFLKQQIGHGAPLPLPHGDEPPTSSTASIPPNQRIGRDDYFLKSNEYIAWLSERKGILFSELGSDEAHRVFEVDFVREWNSGGLRPAYYAGLIQAPVKRTSHKWAFEGSLASHGGGGLGAFLDDKKANLHSKFESDRQERRKDARDQRDRLEEMLPKATGRDAVIEKKMARREEARARDASPDRGYLPGGGDVMGMGGDDSFAAAKAREARQEEWRRNKQLVKREELSAKLASAQAKEDEKMQMFRQMLQQQGGPITIAKRT